MFEVIGSGSDIWGGSDQFHFMFQPITGDVEIVARVAGLQQAHDWSKAGVMIRESLTPESSHAFLLVSAGNGAHYQRRPYAGGGTDNTAGCACSAPAWVRLVRSGNIVTAYESSDGGDWHQVGSEFVAMSPTVYVGLAVTSHNADATASATFTNVMVGGAQAVVEQANHAPSVALVEPWSGAVFASPATITLSADASDADGTIARVDFFGGHQFIGSVAAWPFWMTWYDVPAGIHGLTAVATDNAGATVTSSPVTVTIGATLEDALQVRPSTLLFGPSVDHDTLADFYVLQLRRAGEDTSVEPVATRNLGKPAVADGEVSVDVSEMIHALPDGSYYAVVVSVGPGGAMPSAPSQEFAK